MTRIRATNNQIAVPTAVERAKAKGFTATLSDNGHVMVFRLLSDAGQELSIGRLRIFDGMLDAHQVTLMIGTPK